MDQQRVAGFAVGGLLLVAEGALWTLGVGPVAGAGTSPVHDAMIVAGGPACLVVGLLAASKWERPAGALLWLGAAVLALGIALRSGPRVGPYFLGLLGLVVPQALAASLFLLHARETARSKPARPRG